MNRLLWAEILGAIAALVCCARAEKVDMTPEQLKKTATHVVVGDVAQVFERVETAGGWKVTHCIAEVRVKDVEKGDGVSKGGLVYVRFWHRQWVGEGRPQPDTNGHRGVPARGDSMRIYLARNAYDGFGTTNDGGFNVIGANGFEKLSAAAKDAPSQPK